MIFTAFCFSASLPADEIDEGIPPEIAEAKARYIERVNDETAPPQKRDLFGNQYLFYREGTCPNSEQIESQSKKVYNLLKSKQRPLISFNKTKLIPFDNGGTCSAMALDFLARYITVCSKKRSAEERRECVINFQPFYAKNNKTFVSRQAAYNTIEVKADTPQSEEEIKQQKIQSLANYHGMHLTPVMGTVTMRQLENGFDLKGVIDQLPEGTYVVRMLSPANNAKREYYGHTMTFVKNKDFSVYYDNSRGPLEVTEDLGETVREILIDWGIPEFRIYHATCGDRGCSNLKNDSCTMQRSLSLESEDAHDAFPLISWE
ncbi:hypothetical protein [Estrella lausannensis]|uniref:hypothetical protein n=1 Tax=Estrella lausannensis TaxID=483423 RepID=UPI000BF189C7|nr:hypothetical protein [Estrella lausannensis]